MPKFLANVYLDERAIVTNRYQIEVEAKDETAAIAAVEDAVFNHPELLTFFEEIDLTHVDDGNVSIDEIVVGEVRG